MQQFLAKALSLTKPPVVRAMSQVLVCPPAPKCAACPACKKCPACVCKAPPPTKKTTLQFVLQPGGDKHTDKKAVDGLRVRGVGRATAQFFSMMYDMLLSMLHKVCCTVCCTVRCSLYTIRCYRPYIGFWPCCALCTP